MGCWCSCRRSCGKPLSWTRLFQTTRTDPTGIKVPGTGLVCIDAAGNPVTPPSAPLTSPFAGEVLNPATGLPRLSGQLLTTEATDVAGSFKTSSIRNVELAGPYLHTGGKATLWQLVEFYDEDGHFGNASLSPLMRPLGMTTDQIGGLVAFLVALTDDRVMYQRAPCGVRWSDAMPGSRPHEHSDGGAGPRDRRPARPARHVLRAGRWSRPAGRQRTSGGGRRRRCLATSSASGATTSPAASSPTASVASAASTAASTAWSRSRVRAGPWVRPAGVGGWRTPRPTFQGSRRFGRYGAPFRRTV